MQRAQKATEIAAMTFPKVLDFERAAFCELGGKKDFSVDQPQEDRTKLMVQFNWLHEDRTTTNTLARLLVGTLTRKMVAIVG